MATGKRYYWIKLKENFMNSDLVDHIMDQPHGAEYILIYQMLCMKSINTNGRLELQLGERRIPFTTDKLRRDFRWFNEKRIADALSILKEGQLIDMEADGTIVINDFGELAGCETDYAVQKRHQRTNSTAIRPQSDDSSADIVHTEKDIEKEQDTEIETDTEKDIELEVCVWPTGKEKSYSFADKAEAEQEGVLWKQEH